MQDTSLLSLLTVSYPEALLSAIIIISLIDGVRYIKVTDIGNMLRIISLSVSMTVQSYFIRKYFDNYFIIIVGQTAVYVLLVYVIYWKKFEFKNILKNILIYAFLFLTFQLVILSAIIIANVNTKDILGNYLYIFLWTIPERSLQVLFLISIFKYQKLKKFLSEYKRVKNSAVLTFATIFVLEVLTVFLFVSLSNSASIFVRLVMGVYMGLLVGLNFIIIKLIMVIRADLFKNLYILPERTSKYEKYKNVS